MNPYLLLAPVGGALAAAGLIVAVLWWRGADPTAGRSRTAASKVLGSGVATQRRRRLVQAVLAVAVGMLAWWLSGWPIGGIAVAAGVFFLPFFFTVGRITARRIDKLEALEEWVRRLADTMAAGGAATATIVRSADRAPEAIRPEVRELAGRLGTARWDRVAALRSFANRIDDSLADLIVLSLGIAVSARASDRVPAVLRQVAAAAAEEVRARRQVEVERAAPRNEARVLVLLVVVAVGVMVVFTNFTASYSTGVGQAFLAILVLLMAFALWMIRKYSLGERTPRVLSAADLEPREDQR